MKTLIEEAIESSTLDVFSTMIGVDVRVDADQAPADLPRRVVSTFALSGALAATAVMSCPADLACQISSQLLQSECPEVDADVLDATGEVANMVIGNVKNTLESRWGEIQMSTPSVLDSLKGEARSVNFPDTSVSFRCGTKSFTVTVMFDETPGEPCKLDPTIHHSQEPELGNVQHQG